MGQSSGGASKHISNFAETSTLWFLILERIGEKTLIIDIEKKMGKEYPTIGEKYFLQK